MESISNEKDKGNTKKKLLEALASIVETEGFEKIGVNVIATKAGVSKVLIYRYFGSVDNMIIEYLSENNFWANFSVELPKNDNIRDFIKQMFRNQIAGLRQSIVMRRIQRWELTVNNTVIEKLRLKRESKAITLITVISQLTNHDQEEVAALATIMSTSLTYLSFYSETSPIYNGIDLHNDRGWEQIAKGVDLIIDMWFDYKK